MRTLNKRKAVSPILAVLLMIAVSVALAVVIFTWSQGFLSSTSSAIGTEQGAQNIAAQSQITLENVIPDKVNDLPSGSDTTIGNFTIIVRNVGSVSVSLGTITIQGLPANSGMSGTINILIGSSGSANPDITAITANADTSKIKIYESDGGTEATNSYFQNIAKGDSVTFIVSITGNDTANTDLDLQSGDFITVKATTTVGSFAQYSVTVP
ncbi:MAG: hypothetical protein J7K45_00810 [Thaumarchaeota archaeon]|nr:hypothetical protein [Nitrososphaerota archaeon]